ncbi:undecaprenyldiphospho-muramoylpentapeptide beta-N-acetylglucosaminyltransferase [Candidatus Peregrinibacteria bacterium]|nr:undecaprenyldiphospho-muramoylpentapeptide beta-N-acetylglucosaminyltransferase [Candidatus Peregrinibacteria bacterium]
MRVVFTGGGTGGHVLPNIAIIDEISKLGGAEVFYIGSKKSSEQDIAEGAGLPFYEISTGKLRRYFDLKNFVDFLKVPLGFFQAVGILRKLKPNLVFSKGGYVAVPVVLAARLLGIPVWIHEADLTPGLATKICVPFAGKIWLSFEESRRFYKGRNVEVVGNPVRSSILKGDKKRGYKFTGFSEKMPVCLVIGGSTGAQSLNKLILKNLPELLKKVQVLHITGRIGEKFTENAHYKHFEFLDKELADCYAITDFIVGRAGSGSLFEGLALKKPMILVPLPRSASRGDQIENAEIFEKHGWAAVLNQETLSPEQLLEAILKFADDKKLCDHMSANQKKSPYAKAAKKIAEAILSCSLSYKGGGPFNNLYRFISGSVRWGGETKVSMAMSHSECEHLSSSAL